MRVEKMRIYRKIGTRRHLFSFNLISAKSFFTQTLYVGFCCALIFFVSCSELKKPQITPFYAETAPPQKKEFRWSNGKMPKSFDPARAGAPPETDIVRAIFEGLTETDPVTLKPIPAIASEWSVSPDFKVWTFKLRRDAKWSNGKAITAKDFVNSWQRLGKMGAQVAHRDLLQNIVGMPFEEEKGQPDAPSSDDELFLTRSASRSPLLLNPPSPDAMGISPPVTAKLNETKAVAPEKTENRAFILGEQEKAETKIEKAPAADTEMKFGVEAVNEHVLKVFLIKPDKDFSTLVAHPIFRPVYNDGEGLEPDKLNAGIVTNGAFRLVSVGQDGVTLDRSENYWNKESVELERVRFVPMENAEKALAAYRAGEIDAVTNVNFEPLALKLLTPYDDFRRTTHSAVNFYEFNYTKAPFSDHRVREALAISIDRERLTEGDMEGSTEPAFGFSPVISDKLSKLTQNTEKAKQLLSESGYANGEKFPVIKLVVNRNDLQRKIARSISKMWKQNLNVETEIIVKDAAEIETIRKNGEFDLLRRGVVLPTTNETANMMKIFEPKKNIIKQIVEENKSVTESAASLANSAPEKINTETVAQKHSSDRESLTEILEINGKLILTEEEAVREFFAIPLYFPTSYSLIKPYISGFEINTLDAPSLKDVKIDTAWQPKKEKSES